MRELAPLLQGRHAHACGVYHLGEVQVKYEISRWGPADIWLNINIPWSSFKRDCPDADCGWWHSCGEQAEKHRGVNFFSFAGTPLVCHHLWLWLSPSQVPQPTCWQLGNLTIITILPIATVDQRYWTTLMERRSLGGQAALQIKSMSLWNISENFDEE